MVFFTVAFTVLMWALAIVVYVPTFFYTIPYCLWIGRENTMGRQKDKKKEPYWRSVRNATRLYGAWIRHQKPNF